MRLSQTLPTIIAGAQLCTASSCNDVLKYGSPSSVGLLEEPLKDMATNMSEFAFPNIYGNTSYALEPGSVNLVAHKRTIVAKFTVGKRNLYADANGKTYPNFFYRYVR